MLLDATVVRGEGSAPEINAAYGEIQRTGKCMYIVGYIALPIDLLRHVTQASGCLL